MNDNEIKSVERAVELSEAKETGARKWLGYAVRYILPLALTVALVWYMFKKVRFSEMMDLIRHGVDYWWILMAMGISVLSHVFRAARWRLQLRGLEIYPPFMALCCSIFGCYALNLVFPRLTWCSFSFALPFPTVFKAHHLPSSLSSFSRVCAG